MDDLVERMAEAIECCDKPYSSEALARAANAACFKWRKYENQETLPDGLKAIYSPNEFPVWYFWYGPLAPPKEDYPRWFIELPEPPKGTGKEKK